MHLLNAEEPAQVGAMKVLASFSSGNNQNNYFGPNGVILGKDGRCLWHNPIRRHQRSLWRRLRVHYQGESGVRRDDDYL